jgi:hypothetical protein
MRIEHTNQALSVLMFIAWLIITRQYQIPILTAIPEVEGFVGRDTAIKRII